MNKARHAFGSSQNVKAALEAGTINERDILFLDESTDHPKVGWVSKDGEVVIVEGEEYVITIEGESLPESGENGKIYLFKDEGYFWNSSGFSSLSKSADLSELEAEISVKMNADEAEEKYEKVKYEIADVPMGTLIDYSDKEIRVMCPANAVWTKQSVGAGGDANSYYMTFKTYAPDDNAVGYIEHLNGESDEEILVDLKTDEYGRRYQPTWLAIAKHDESTDTWTYYGKDSSTEKYIGWNYQIDWYDADGVVIASDSVRINLSNEDCHSAVEPYYMSNVLKAAQEYVDVQIEEAVNGAIEVVEF